MFSFFKKKPATEAESASVFTEVAFADALPKVAPTGPERPLQEASTPPSAPGATGVQTQVPVPELTQRDGAGEPLAQPSCDQVAASEGPAAPPVTLPLGVESLPPAVSGPAPIAMTPPASVALVTSMEEPPPAPATPPPMVPPSIHPAPKPETPRAGWLARLSAGLRKTGSSLAGVFSRTKIDDALYEELEEALLMADAGVKATEQLLDDLKRRVREARVTEPQAVKALLVDAIAELLRPLERPLEIGRHAPTVMMVVGVNGAGKTTSIGKLTRHLLEAEQKVLMAAADTFRAAAREQLAVWAQRADGSGVQAAGAGWVDIVSQQGGDPAAVTFDAVVAGKARGCDVVIADTAGRLPTQLHLMEELKKIKRVITKAQLDAPHEVLLVVDGNTGQNALTQVKAFDDALQLTGLIVTKLDGTAKGGVLAAIARERPIPVYFIGVGEKLEDLQTFSAREFAQALLS
ncbi:signal recognition particle-docking protein FtsY [Inhella gelatinilytica]|uniref:Signal recognition particle receptor FtsY n=1 Tax=Inhella gelatinilytica TaxID=2795030 RepID=A0A931IYX7_9BURK|nr:signal recognition particle-docking protein FtsY [Inhella gelatinilytica]MBH9552376.1 signal recognition particle-docking protein FtsY [Inhella gelatinilytica]